MVFYFLKIVIIMTVNDQIYYSDLFILSERVFNLYSKCNLRVPWVLGIFLILFYRLRV